MFWLVLFLCKSCNVQLQAFHVHTVDGAIYNYFVFLTSDTGLLAWTGNNGLFECSLQYASKLGVFPPMSSLTSSKIVVCTTILSLYACSSFSGNTVIRAPSTLFPVCSGGCPYCLCRPRKPLGMSGWMAVKSLGLFLKAHGPKTPSTDVAWVDIFRPQHAQ